jgi:tetratricopeptide (TPR) repeat protein
MRIIAVLVSVFFTCTAIAQTKVESIVHVGIEYHEMGNFDKAIETYKDALALEPDSPLANYEMGLAYYGKREYKEAIRYYDKVITQNAGLALEATINKGLSLDLMGKGAESFKLFKKAARKFKEHYLISYNLAFHYYKLRNLAKAREYAIRTIEIQRDHPSSHLLLAYMQMEENNKVESLLSFYFYLMLEPGSDRAREAYNHVQKLMYGNIEKKEKAFNITLSEDSMDSEFSAAEMMLSFLGVERSIKENEGEDKIALAIAQTTSFFKILGELKENDEEKHQGIYWEYYIPFFERLSETEHMEAYYHRISEGSTETSRLWVMENPEKLYALKKWVYK